MRVRTKISTLLFVSLLLIGIMPRPSYAAGPRTNIIWIMADDLGYGDLGCFGQQSIQTPYLDQMATEGMRLTDFYAGCTVCRPSRLVLWTGYHSGHTPINSNRAYQFQPADVTVAELLQQEGYVTGGVGKWAMGGVDSTGHPNLNGFDFWMGYLDQGQAHNYYPTHLWRNREKIRLPGNILDSDPFGRGRVAKKKGAYAHDLITEEAFQFIERRQDQPFLLNVHWTIPHANNEAGKLYGDGMETPDHGPYENEKWPSTAKGHAAMITRLDNDVGRLLALLRKLELQERTLVIFTSDNGPHSEGGHSHEFFDSNGPLRGFKRDLYEGGIRVPAIAWWPGTIKPGSKCDQPLAFQDFLPTACDLAGVSSIPNVDGISFAATLRGECQPAREYLYWRYGSKRALRAGNWKAVQLSPDNPMELYDLAGDIGENTDLADQRGDITKQMAALMADAERPGEP